LQLRWPASVAGYDGGAGFQIRGVQSAAGRYIT